MSRKITFYEIKDRTITDFSRLVSLLEHGVLNFNSFEDSANVLINSFMVAVREERRTGENNND